MPAFTVPSAELEDLERSGFVAEDGVADLSSKGREELEALLDEVTEAILCAQPKSQQGSRRGRRSGSGAAASSGKGKGASTATFTEALTSNFGLCYSFVKHFASSGSAMGSAARLRVADLLSCAVSDLVAVMRARARASAAARGAGDEDEDDEDDLEDDLGDSSTLTAGGDDLPANFADALKMYSYLLSECVVRAEKLCRTDADLSKGRPKAPKGPKGKKKRRKKKSKDDDEDADDTLAAFCAE